MVSYGFEEIEDFYAQSSTRSVVGNVKIPVLFIQVHSLYLLCLFFFLCIIFHISFDIHFIISGYFLSHYLKENPKGKSN